MRGRQKRVAFNVAAVSGEASQCKLHKRRRKKLFVDRDQHGREEAVRVDAEDWVVAKDGVGCTEAAQGCQHGNSDGQVATRRVAGEDDVLEVHAELLLGLCDDPDVRLIAVVHRVREGVLRRESVVDTEDRNADVDRPLARVALVGR